MKMKFLFSMILLLPLLAISQQRWEVTFGENDIDNYQHGIVDLNDAGNIIYCDNNDNHYTTLFKVDINGNLLWIKDYVDEYLEAGIHPGSMCTNSDKKLIVGNIYANGAILLLDGCGDKLWCKKYDNTINNFWAVGFTDAIMLDSIILVSAFTQDNDYIWGVYLMGFDYDGNLLWDKPIASHLTDPLLAEPIPAFLKKVGNDIFIVGDCYYAYPGNPNVFHWRPMFIKLDSLYNKEWFLPYGMADHISGTGFGLLQLDSNEFRGYGRTRIDDTLHSIFMNFDADGNETRHKIIPINAISPDVRDDDLRALNIIDDTTYYITSQIGVNHYDKALGEFTVDTSGTTVYHYQNHPEIVQGNLHPTVKTQDSCFITVASVQNTTLDILLYKLNADLSQAAIDTNSYVYDSLCPHPITSDTIYLDDCDIVTSVPQFPSPQAYYEAKQKVEITAYPNPASGDVVNFKLKYTKYHSNLQLTVYDIGGKLMSSKGIATGQKQASINVSAFPPGMYVAVVRNNRKVLGKVVFGVQKREK